MTPPRPSRPTRSGTALQSLSVALLMGLCVATASHAAEPTGREGAARPPRIRGPVDDEDRVTLTRNRHPSVDTSEDLGAADDALRIERLILTLQPDTQQADELERHLADVSDPASPQHGRWLDAGEFERRFGVDASDVQTVVDWLQRHGFTVDEIPPGRRSIVFSGNVAQVRAAFRTDMRRLRSRGREHLANTSDPQIPEALSAVVIGVVSLHDFRSRPLHVNRQPAPSFTSGSSHAMAPADFATIYNLKPLTAQGLDGAGRSIAVLGRTAVVDADITTFRSAMNLLANPVQVIVNGANPGRQTGDEGESDLDLEWAGAVAPGAKIQFVTSASTATTDGVDLSAQYAVTRNVGDVITLSYGLCEADLGAAAVNFYNSLWQQATAQGQTVFVSSGDSGAADCDGGNATTALRGRAVNGLCTSPYSTCVGGTQFADTANPALYWSANTDPVDQSSVLSYIPEVVWNESGTVSGGSGLWSSGGGASTVFTKPAWQVGTGVPADGRRDVPDVSLAAASHDGYLVYSSDNATSTRALYTFGGTSASAPSFAGIAALIGQRLGARLGHINPRLYQLSAAQAGGGPAYFHRITTGNNSVPGQLGFTAGTAAYNQATGLGSVDVAVLVNGWTDVLPASSTAISVDLAAPFVGQPVTLRAVVSVSPGSPAPTGQVQFLDAGVAMGGPAALVGGAASLTLGTSSLAALTVGSHAIAAVYRGDTSNQASASPELPLTVGHAVSTLNLSATRSSVTAGQGVAFTATVHSPGLAPGGTVQFFDGATPLAEVPLAVCAAGYSLNTLGVGPHNILARYSGDANNAASDAVPLAISVNAVVPSVGLTVSSIAGPTASVSTGAVISLGVSVAGAAGVTPTGTVDFLDGGTLLGRITLVGGVASFSTSNLSVGVHSLSAAYSGDAIHQAITSPLAMLTVTAAVPPPTGDVPLPAWSLGLLGTWLLARRTRCRPPSPQTPDSIDSR